MTTKLCHACQQTIPLLAKRCQYCTARINYDGMEISDPPQITQYRQPQNHNLPNSGSSGSESPFNLAGVLFVAALAAMAITQSFWPLLLWFLGVLVYIACLAMKS